MIVLAVINREAVPSNAKPGLHQEDYTFALEQALLHHFTITNYDGRIANPVAQPYTGQLPMLSTWHSD